MKKGKDIKRAHKREVIFAASILAVPVLWWAFTFAYTTLGSIGLAFKTYDYDTGEYVFCGLDTIIKMLKELFSGGLITIAMKNSVLLWLSQVFIAIPLAVIVSFALYKKVYGGGIFKVILFLPQIISSMVWITAVKYIIELGFEAADLLNYASPTTKYTLWIYMLWLGFAGNMVMYTGAMSRIPPSLAEAGHLDGMTDMQEFFYIVLPLIFSTLSVILITCIISIFTLSFPAYSFFGFVKVNSGQMDYIYTFGLYTFIKGYIQDVNHVPTISALSLIICAVAAPASLGIKTLLNKISPDVEY